MITNTAIGQLTLRSDAFANRGNIPPEYTCEGVGDSPPLEIGEIPEDTQSLALIMDDPDAPKGVFTHWLVWNIPLVSVIKENSNPGISGTNSGGKTGYHPPCPPTGRHRYYFKLYALDTTLDLPAGSEREALEMAMQDHIIAQGELMGYYGD